MEYDSTENESIQLCAPKWMNLRNMILSDKSASQTTHMQVNSKDVKLNNTLLCKAYRDDNLQRKARKY